jgi:hypothetical protein
MFVKECGVNEFFRLDSIGVLFCGKVLFLVSFIICILFQARTWFGQWVTLRELGIEVLGGVGILHR